VTSSFPATEGARPPAEGTRTPVADRAISDTIRVLSPVPVPIRVSFAGRVAFYLLLHALGGD